MKGNIKSNIKKACLKLIFKANYILNNYNDIIWLLGDGRSGTTWVANLINHDKKFREIFEPFHPKRNIDMHFIVPHQYYRPNEINEELKSISSTLFSGKYTNKKVDVGSHTLLYKGLLIKDIFANLLCYPTSLEFPNIKPILLIRNPFSVALSKSKKKNWFWGTDPLELLNQASLREDYLLPFEDLIKEVSARNNYILNQILIWSIINYIPLKQFKPSSIHICFYECIYENPNDEITKIFEFLWGTSSPQKTNITFTDEFLSKPSHVIGKDSNLLSGTSPILSWKDEIPLNIIEDGLNIMKHFELHELYGENGMPNINVLKKIHGVN
ncbi:sulfotransferase domain-containing protein [Psychromonas sp. PT13]|uniref:sulfotransferase domain-containing protein n=1 Tax=Psychromonas sp. PT13 TaxID=3439547 RepID=UPI003EC061EB